MQRMRIALQHRLVGFSTVTAIAATASTSDYKEEKQLAIFESLPAEIYIHILSYLLFTSPKSLDRLACVSWAILNAVETLYRYTLLEDAHFRINEKISPRHLFWAERTSRKHIYRSIIANSQVVAKRQRRTAALSAARKAVQQRIGTDTSPYLSEGQKRHLTSPLVIGLIAQGKLTIEEACLRSAPDRLLHLSTEQQEFMVYKIGLSVDQCLSMPFWGTQFYTIRLSHLLRILTEENIPISRLNSLDEKIFHSLLSSEELNALQLLIDIGINFEQIIAMQLDNFPRLDIYYLALEFLLIELNIPFKEIAASDSRKFISLARSFDSREKSAAVIMLIDAAIPFKTLMALDGQLLEKLVKYPKALTIVLTQAKVPIEHLLPLSKIEDYPYLPDMAALAAIGSAYTAEDITPRNRLEILFQHPDLLHKLLIELNIPFCKIAEVVTASTNFIYVLKSPETQRTLQAPPGWCFSLFSTLEVTTHAGLNEEITQLKKIEQQELLASLSLARLHNRQAKETKITFLTELERLFKANKPLAAILTFIRHQQNQHLMLVAAGRTARLLVKIKQFCMKEEAQLTVTAAAKVMRPTN